MRGSPILIVAGFAAVVAAGTHCSSFGENEPSGDAGALDAVASEAGVNEAAADSGSASACVRPDCEPFDPGWENAWTESPQGALGTTSADSVSPPSSVEVVVSSNGPKFVFRPILALKRVVVVSGWMKVVQPGEGELDFFGVRTTGNDGAWVVHPKGQGMFVIEAYGPSGMATPPIATTFADWTFVRLEIRRDEPRLYYDVGGTKADVALSAAFKTGDLGVEIGARFAQAVTAPWTVRFDDVRVSTSD